MAVQSGQLDSWEAVLNGCSAEDMQKESEIKWMKDKTQSNAYQRLKYIQKLFGQTMSKTEEKSDNKDKEDEEEVEFAEPIEDPLDLSNGKSKLIEDEVGMYQISSVVDMALDCKFNFKGNGKYYYEVQLIEDPMSYRDLNIGFCSESHDSRTELGQDPVSYGYNGVKSKLYHMDPSYGKTEWKEGDILGFALDLTENKSKMEFFLNDESQGVAFTGDGDIEYAGNALFAAFSLQKEQSGTLIFAESALKGKKPADYQCIQIESDDIDSLWKIDGDLNVEKVDNGFKLTADGRFPTATLKGAELAKGGKYYFEFELITAGFMQLGFADSEFETNAARGAGVGDDEHSWAIDLYKKRKWGTFGKKYNCDAQWAKDDVIGCCLDLDNKTISYSLNGKDLGIAFENVNDSKGLRPAFSIRNVPVRQKLIDLYRALEQKAKEDPDADIQPPTPPEPIVYLNLIFAEKGYKYKPDGYQAIMEHVVFKAKEICDSLTSYSYKQYAADYKFMDTVIKLSRDEEFDEICKAVGDDTLIVCDFWATWCGPCIRIAPVYHDLSQKFKDVVFLKADVDALSKLSREQEIQCMPTFKFFKGGKELLKVEGGDLKAIINGIEKYRENESEQTDGK